MGPKNDPASLENDSTLENDPASLENNSTLENNSAGLENNSVGLENDSALKNDSASPENDSTGLENDSVGLTQTNSLRIDLAPNIIEALGANEVQQCSPDSQSGLDLQSLVQNESLSSSASVPQDDRTSTDAPESHLMENNQLANSLALSDLFSTAHSGKLPSPKLISQATLPPLPPTPPSQLPSTLHAEATPQLLSDNQT